MIPFILAGCGERCQSIWRLRECVKFLHKLLLWLRRIEFEASEAAPETDKSARRVRRACRGGCRARRRTWPRRLKSGLWGLRPPVALRRPHLPTGKRVLAHRCSWAVCAIRHTRRAAPPPGTEAARLHNGAPSRGLDERGGIWSRVHPAPFCSHRRAVGASGTDTWLAPPHTSGAAPLTDKRVNAHQRRYADQ